MAPLQLAGRSSLLCPTCGLPSKARCLASRLSWGQCPSTQRHGLQVVQARRQSTASRPLCQAAAGYGLDSDTITSEDIKASLLDSLFGTNRGANANAEVRAEINELISQLEAKNPTPAPNEASDKLNGQWKLVYTFSSELIPLLAASRLPFIEIGDIMQTIDTTLMTVDNKVVVTGPFARQTVCAGAQLEVRSPKRLSVRFNQSIFQTPELMQNIDIPSYVNVLGTPLDLTGLKDALNPIETSLQNLAGNVNSFVQQQPDLCIPIPTGTQAESWLLTTYLDNDMRIARGDGGSIFVLTKETFGYPMY